MTKSKKKLKSAGKKRQRRSNVAKRKVERALQKEKEIAELHEKKVKQQVDAFNDDPTEEVAGVNINDLVAGKDGLVVERSRGATGGKNNIVVKKKQLTRKQLKRKAKSIEKGEATSAYIKKKVRDKKMKINMRVAARKEVK